MILKKLTKATLIAIAVIILLSACASKKDKLDKEPVLMETKLLLMENNPTVDERKKTAEAIRTAVEFPTALEKDKCLKLADLIEQGEIEKAKDLYNELKDGN